MRLLSLFFLLGWSLVGQESGPPPASAPTADQLLLKRNFSSLQLGDSAEATKDKLRQDRYFSYNGEPEIDFSRQPEPALRVEGRGFIRQANLLFYQQKLYRLELTLNTELVSYETVLSTLNSRYRQAAEIDQRRAIWQNGETRLSLEYPAVVSITDLQALEAMRTQAQERSALLARDRSAFLEQF